MTEGEERVAYDSAEFTGDQDFHRYDFRISKFSRERFSMRQLSGGEAPLPYTPVRYHTGAVGARGVPGRGMATRQRGLRP